MDSMMMSQINKSKYVYCVGVDVIQDHNGQAITHETEIPVYSDALTETSGTESWINAVEFALTLAQSQYPDAKLGLASCKSWN